MEAELFIVSLLFVFTYLDFLLVYFVMNPPCGAKIKSRPVTFSEVSSRLEAPSVEVQQTADLIVELKPSSGADSVF